MLKFDGKWRFESPGTLEPEVVHRFRNLIDRTCGQGNRKAILERFKRSFAKAAFEDYYPSSNVGWASNDLDELMNQASDNAPLFIEAFFGACEKLRDKHPDLAVPGVEQINHILSNARVGFQVAPPDLFAVGESVSIPVPDDTPSLDRRAKDKIDEALVAVDHALREGKGRQAVLGLVWLLETISTAFRSPELAEQSIQGRYFSKIILELRDRGHDHQKQIFGWMRTLHGFLSSPTGGGIRHGVDLTHGTESGINEARLYCNLIRSYLTYLIAEHERISDPPT